MTTANSFVIGSIESMPEYDLTITGGGGGADTVATGSYYLWDATTANSLCDQVQAAMTAQSITGADVFVTAGGYVRIEGSTSFTIVWDDSALRNLLGFAATVGPTTGATAPNKSPLFWGPGWPETPDSPVGTHGNTVSDTVITQSATGQTMRSRKRSTMTTQRFKWRNVTQARVWTTSEAGGEYRRFFDDSFSLGYRFKLYSGVTETAASTSEFSSAYTLGPYKAGPTIDHKWFRRVDPTRDTLANIEFQCVKVSEYT